MRENAWLNWYVKESIIKMGKILQDYMRQKGTL